MYNAPAAADLLISKTLQSSPKMAVNSLQKKHNSRHNTTELAAKYREVRQKLPQSSPEKPQSLLQNAADLAVQTNGCRTAVPIASVKMNTFSKTYSSKHLSLNFVVIGMTIRSFRRQCKANNWGNMYHKTLSSRKRFFRG